MWSIQFLLTVDEDINVKMVLVYVFSHAVSSQELGSDAFECLVQTLPIKFCTVTEITLKVKLIGVERVS